MHRCLKLQEILRIIFEYSLPVKKAGNGREVSKDTPSLARLARTCRTFQDPALDVLYAGLKSIEPLFLCIPDFIVTRESKIFDYTFEHEPSRQMTTEDWETFLRYSSRVRALGVANDGDEHPTLPVSLYEELCSKWDPSNPPFPRLRRLRWQELRPETFPLLRPSIHLDLPSLCPNLKKLFFFWTDEKNIPERPTLSIISDHLCADKWNELEAFGCGLELDQKARTALARMKSLQQLCLRMTSVHPHYDPGFPALRHLNLISDNLIPYIDFLRHSLTGDQILHSVRLVSTNMANSASWAEMIELLAKRCSPTGVTEIDISDYSFAPDYLGEPIQSDPIPISIAPLIFPCLTALVVQPSGLHVALNDDLVHSIASTCTLLKHLELGTRHQALDTPSTVTLKKGLGALIQNCRGLETLAIVLDARNTKVSDILPDEFTGSEIVFSNTLITSLDLGSSPIVTSDPLVPPSEDPVRGIATFIARILPNVADISSEAGTSQEARIYGTTWTKVAAIVKDIATRQRQETNGPENYESIWTTLFLPNSDIML
ncbi:hypothetical protein BJ138DRAFT_1161333 [Hygrophoropsis aurantiaca]|uniref:Uncharacterized protein n=1 Tax=Hygrophoropsis aurantiaca TaxID=72124 RepID=A0ACB8A2P0_9AGAM|nr:hypothetical protein BJ138DRAFT_1161333 [Hygrophoropsis aurantiaca]